MIHAQPLSPQKNIRVGPDRSLGDKTKTKGRTQGAPSLVLLAKAAEGIQVCTALSPVRYFCVLVWKASSFQVTEKMGGVLQGQGSRKLKRGLQRFPIGSVAKFPGSREEQQPVSRKRRLRVKESPKCFHWRLNAPAGKKNRQIPFIKGLLTVLL